MRPFTADHPRLRSPPGAMSGDEIRYWIRELKDNHSWSMKAMADVLGTSRNSLWGKLFRGWIYPGEQIRFSRGLRRIIAGEVICVREGRKPKAVVAADPKPLKLPPRFRYNLATGRAEFVQQHFEVPRSLPSFRDLMTTAKPWRPE